MKQDAPVLLSGCRKDHFCSPTVPLPDKISQRLAGIAAVIAMDGTARHIIHKPLQDFSGQSVLRIKKSSVGAAFWSAGKLVRLHMLPSSSHPTRSGAVMIGCVLSMTATTFALAAMGLMSRKPRLIDNKRQKYACAVP